VKAKDDAVIGGGEILQPVLYALVLEKLFAGTKVESGRLYYCTATGGFKPVDIPLTKEARDAAALVAKSVGDAVSSGFLPAAPAKDACKYCDFRPVCGPYEEIRTRRKDPRRLEPLKKLRKHR
jgi:ATP-dependent helicase/nuclease subunit B